MKFAQIGAPGAEQPVLVHEGRHYSLSSLTPAIDGNFLSQGGPAAAAAALAAGTLPEISSAGMRYGAPIARPSAVICVGLNYAAHAAESGAEPPEHPVIFLKTPNTVGGPDDAVDIPRGSTRTDWEVELGRGHRKPRLVPGVHRGGPRATLQGTWWSMTSPSVTSS